MGTDSFITTGSGRTAREAFDAAREDARDEYGHGGYTGSVAEKASMLLITDDGAPLKTRLTSIISDLRGVEKRIGHDARDLAASVTAILRRHRVHVWVDDTRLRCGAKREVRTELRRLITELRTTKSRCKARMDPYDIANVLLEIGDTRFYDKWAPAGCIDLTPRRKRDKEFLFFGWASC